MFRILATWIGAVALSLAALPALATQDAWPALFDVRDVTADDVLNIRAGPSVRFPVIGTLRPDRADVEVIAPNDRETWGRINTGEGVGWVSLRYLARQPGQWQGAFPEISSCFGTEPFWTLSLTGDDAHLATPDSEAAGTVSARLGSAARRDRHGLIATLGGTTLTGVIATRSCSDGMSDRAFGLAFDAVMGDEVLSGCCTLTP
ncbi:MAG: SH3 domain-containing protein [Jannaschia sp.]